MLEFITVINNAYQHNNINNNNNDNQQSIITSNSQSVSRVTVGVTYLIDFVFVSSIFQIRFYVAKGDLEL